MTMTRHTTKPVTARSRIDRLLGEFGAGQRVGWSAGFGPTLDPYQANLTGRSHGSCRDRLDRVLRLHARYLATGDDERAAFDRVRLELATWPKGQRWERRLHAGNRDLTFWILPADEARDRGAREKL
ncbi:MAG: hypothetical protein S0880_27245 [Actinomycetota bacterium]|nr:hypothetical protein [Actinomycetota bacterium]